MPIRISITGDLGSGKTTVCGELNRKYNMRIFSTGAIHRRIAAEMGMSAYDLNIYMETHPEIDQMIDGELIELSNSAENIAIDSRMAWHFVENTFNVFLITDETVAAQRVVSDKRGPTEVYTGVHQAKELLKARKQSENYRYKDKYGVDCHDYRNYDLILDTTYISPDYAAETVMYRYSLWEKEDKTPAFLISPLCLYPTGIIRDTSLQTIDDYCSLILSDKPVQPIEIVVLDGIFYIYDGYNRATAFLKMKKPLVPCVMIAQNADIVVGNLTAAEYVQREFTLDKAHDWEDLNGFKFLTYP